MGFDRGTAAAFAAIVCFGGLNAVAVRIVDRELAPIWGAGLRFGLAALVLFVIWAIRRSPRPDSRMLGGAIAYGVLGFGVAFGLIHWGLVESPAGVAQVLLATVPILTLILAVSVGLERFSWKGVIGAIVALAGIAVVFSGAIASAVAPVSVLAILGAAVSMAAANIVVKRFPRPDLVVFNAIGMTAGAALLMIVSVATGEMRALAVSWETVAALAYLVLLGSVAVFSLFLFVITRWIASAASYVMLLMPLVTVAAAALLTGEQPTLAYLLGGGLVITGVAIGLRRARTSLPAARRAPRLTLAVHASDSTDHPASVITPGCA